MSNYSHQGRYAGDYDSKSTPATLKPHRKHTRTSHDSYQVVDPASKRLFFLSLFVLLESWKIYDAIALKSSKIGVNITSLNKFTFVVKYFLLEGIFFWTLPLFNVSQLSFNPVTTFIITAVLNILTFFLVSDSTIPIVGGLIFPAIDFIRQKSELTLAGDLVRSGTAIDIDSYFKGRYTIHYVPDSTAFFNPFENKDFCLIDGSAIGVPVQFNTTNELGWLQLQHISPEKEVSLFNYTRTDIAKLLKRDYSHLIHNPGYISNDERIFYLELPLRDPGQYSIKEVRDVDGLKIRTYKSDLTISSCPSARVISSVDDSQYICVPEPNRSKLGSLTLPQVEVNGVYPMELEFAVSIGKKIIKLRKVTINGKPPENGQINLRLARSVKNIFLESLSDKIDLPEVANGPLEFRILLVRDALNVNRKYNPHSNARDLLGSIDLKTKPVVKLSDRNRESKLLVNGTKNVAISVDRSRIQEADWPITIMIEYLSPSKLSSYNFSRVFHSVHEASKGFEVAKSGSYRLVSASTKFCDCKLDGRTIKIDRADPPQIEITSEPIVDKCVGMTGYNFKFDAKGQPPFQVQYQVFQNKSNGVLRPVHDAYGNVHRTLRFQDETYDFEYKPPGEGNYIVVFKSLRDGYYQKTGIPLDEKVHTYLTYFRQRSRLSIEAADDSNALPICLGSQVDVPISMSGNFPFLMSYKVIEMSSGKVIESSTVKDLSDSRFIIQTPKFDKGGSYRVQIDKLTDSLGCEANLVGQNYRTVNVRKDIPEMSLGIEADSWSVSIVEGDSLKLPLNVQSSVGNTQRDRLVYSITDLNNSSDTKVRTAIGIENLRIKEAGRYKLLSYSSGGCEGKVANPQKVITVDYIPRPSIVLGAIDRGDLKNDDFEGQLGPVCRGGTKKVEMFLNGKRPFIVNYQIKDPSGRVESRTMTVNNDRVTITLPTENHGIYRHKFLSVYDSLYTQEKTSRLNVPPLTSQLQYEVQSLPELAIKSGSEYLQFCESTLKKISKLPPKIQLNLKGQFPVTLDVTLQRGDANEQEEFQVKHLTTSEVDLNDIISSINGKALDQTLQVGDYFLLFDRITDNNGCSKQIQDANVVVLVTEVPKMKREPNQKYYCVGDHITYDLVGISPFTVFYNFNGNSRKAQLHNKFSRLASKPGNLTITALLDSSIDHCLVNFTDAASSMNSLQAEIHDLPSVEVNQGEYIVRNIHEGDKTEIKFSFTGVPPFSLTYVRMLEENSKDKGPRKQHKPRVVEKETIDNIWDHEYVLMASLEGTYEAIEVRDAYCKALKIDYVA